MQEEHSRIEQTVAGMNDTHGIRSLKRFHAAFVLTGLPVYYYRQPADDL